mmetsp:Transcript_2565/g.4133  ORF Transcript_2565/g.4133 Transcript_2565/m.4133 type:complete len:601 (-) Transcript_2565:128-1930(-)
MMMLSFASLLILPLLSTAHTTADWYQRYDAYPPYCSIPEEMNKRTIPPLRPNVHLGDSRLAHVTAVIRHGARTPWSANINCWDGYWEEGSDTAVWNCGLTTFLAPPTPRVVDEEEGIYASETDAMFLFEKKYDALSYPQHNELNGTCQRGQLLLQGYDQELTNGEQLREAYVYDGKTMNHDIKLRLLDLSDKINRPYDEPILKYRADDDQRTLMSGQILLRGLFGTEFIEHLKNTGQHPVIPLHVADRSEDVLAPYGLNCPRLLELEETAEKSMEFKAFNNSKEAKTLYRFIEHQLGSLGDPLECLMTTICTDRILPDAVNDYTQSRRELHSHSGGDGDDDDDDDHHHKYGTELFERLTKFDTQRAVFPYIYNDGEYSKVAMGPLWAEIFEAIEPIVNGGSDRGLSDNKLHVVSGHDTTLVPLLASLGIWNVEMWPAYASMMLLEVHELIDGKTDRTVYPTPFAFRLIFNGEVWTDKVKGCHKDHDLCDFQVLRQIVEPFALRDRECALTNTKQSSLSIQRAQGLLTSPGGIFMFLLLICVSAGLGAFGMLWYLKRGSGRIYRSVYDGTGISMTNNGVRYRDQPAADDDDKAEVPTMLVV